MSTYDPTDLKENERKKVEESAAKRQSAKLEEDDIKWLASSKRGRRILWRLLEKAGVFRLSFNTNAMQMAFNEGNRNFGNWVLAVLNAASPETLNLMMCESREGDDRDR